jgi:hypothetical protein
MHMPLNHAAEPVERVPLAGPQMADRAVSDTMRRWDARQALLKRQPLVALAFHAIAIKDERAGSQMNMIAVLAGEAREALKASGVDLALIDELYPRASCAVYAVRG